MIKKTDELAGQKMRVALPWSALVFVALWAWAIWSCAEHWLGNPNYSYGWVVPPLALAFGLRRYWMVRGEFLRAWRVGLSSIAAATVFALICGAAVFGLEFARQEMWHPQIVLDFICLLAIAYSLALFFADGGGIFVRSELFPVLFFLTAVPWPARLEQPITSRLMQWVAVATVECLHWLGVEARTSGGAIALHSGLVGITEACSGIRSLQAGIMFGLAIGEWFLLRPTRRIVLLASAIVLALLTNLVRTLALSLQAEWNGVESVERIHDLVGNIIITALIVGIWLAGKFLARRRPAPALLPWQKISAEARAIWRRLCGERNRALAGIALLSLGGFILARVTYARLEARDHSQTEAFFVARPNANAGDQVVNVPREIWNELRPTSGEFIQRNARDLPRGAGYLYHFFWKPSPWNRFALVHRPDICMPGVGWKLAGTPELIEVKFEGRAVSCYAFHFERGRYRALQLWGVWRNGDLVSLDYEPGQVLGDKPAAPQLQLEGKRRSATEIVACSLISENGAPSPELAVALLQSIFEYRPR